MATTIDIKHLAHVQVQINEAIKRDTRNAILDAYTISDQLNATGSAKTTMQTAIAALVTAGATKQAAVSAATTWAELNAIVPDSDA